MSSSPFLLSEIVLLILIKRSAGRINWRSTGNGIGQSAKLGDVGLQVFIVFYLGAPTVRSIGVGKRTYETDYQKSRPFSLLMTEEKRCHFRKYDIPEEKVQKSVIGLVCLKSQKLRETEVLENAEKLNMEVSVLCLRIGRGRSSMYDEEQKLYC